MIPQQEQIFEHTDRDDERLRVRHIEEDVSPIGRRLMVVADNVQEGGLVEVAFSREEGIKMARAILAALDAEPEPGLTHRALDGMPEGAEVYDNVMEKWTKSGYEWKFYAGALLRSSVDLIEQYGPITAKAQAQ